MGSSKSDREQRLVNSKASEAASIEAKKRKVKLNKWLRKVPDDPGGLLRRKLLRDYWQRKMETGS